MEVSVVVEVAIRGSGISGSGGIRGNVGISTSGGIRYQ